MLARLPTEKQTKVAKLLDPYVRAGALPRGTLARIARARLGATVTLARSIKRSSLASCMKFQLCAPACGVWLEWKVL